MIGLPLFYSRIYAVICLVFDLSDPGTLINCEKWLRDALDTNWAATGSPEAASGGRRQRSSESRPAIFLVGTKKDLLVSLY